MKYSEQVFAFDVEATMKVRVHLAGPTNEAAARAIVTNVLMQDPAMIRLFVMVDKAGRPIFNIVGDEHTVTPVRE